MTTTPGVYRPRGVVKAFREFLNRTCADGPKHRERRYHQETRGYGDYLYAQDREKFNVDLDEALADDNSDFARMYCRCEQCVGCERSQGSCTCKPNPKCVVHGGRP